MVFLWKLRILIWWWINLKLGRQVVRNLVRLMTQQLKKWFLDRKNCPITKIISILLICSFHKNLEVLKIIQKMCLEVIKCKSNWDRDILLVLICNYQACKLIKHQMFQLSPAATHKNPQVWIDLKQTAPKMEEA